jgi:hypothetical protein
MLIEIGELVLDGFATKRTAGEKVSTVFAHATVATGGEDGVDNTVSTHHTHYTLHQFFLFSLQACYLLR